MAHNLRKRKQSEVNKAPALQLRPLHGAQIEAVTKTYNDLRAQNVNSEVEFPATVVAGDTSSGKSSVMSRLTGLPFPRGEGVVTRFATEVAMMPAPKEEIQVSIRPDAKRSADQQTALLRFKRNIESTQLEETFAQASTLLSQLDERGLYGDILHISLQGPSCQPLTVIDLPGLIHAATQKVSDHDRRLSEWLAKEYLKENRTIILAVISASNDVVNQAVTRMTRKVDKHGERTLGIVTKVDTVCGKAKDNQLFSILSNEEIPLKLGWHALVNVIDGDDTATEEQIIKAEKKFFEGARFRSIDKSTTGIDDLRKRVVQVVGEKLVGMLPVLQQDVWKKLQGAQVDLQVFGQPIADIASQRKALVRICNHFQAAAQAEISGVCSNDALLEGNGEGHERLGSYIERLYTDFASAMRVYGSTRRFQRLCIATATTESISSENDYSEWFSYSQSMDRNQALQWVYQIQRSSSQSSISGSANDQVVAQLFRELSKNWANFARTHLDTLATMCKETIADGILDHSTKYTASVSTAIDENWIHPHLDAKLAEVKLTIDELEKDRLTTLKAFTPRLDDLKEDKLRKLAETSNYYGRRSSSETAALTNLAHALAYCEVDLEYWTTAVIKQVAERFVCCIPKALSSELVYDLSDEQVKAVMKEPERQARKREALTKTVHTMEFALSKLQAQIKCLQ